MADVSAPPCFNARKRSALRWSRRVVQLVALVLFLWLVSRMNVMALMSGGVPPEALLVLDPLVALTGAIDSARNHAWALVGFTLLASLPLLMVTVLFGRLFCGWLCPLGTCIDISDRLVTRQRNDTLGSRWHGVKYALLAACILTALLDHQLLYLLDPIPLVTRTFAVWVFPMFGAMASAMRLMPPSDASLLFGAGYLGNLLVAGIFLIILGLGFMARRFWCRGLCPLGALLGLVSRVAPFGRTVNAECTSCGACSRGCRMAATPDGKTLAPGECLLCGECQAICPTGMVRFGKRGQPAPVEVTDLGRRRVLGAAAFGVAWAGIFSTGALARIQTRDGVANKVLLRPPAAMPEGDFLARCTRCGACIKSCPTGGLQPALTEAGIEGIMTPVLAPRLGECTVGCNACAHVCPTKAIRHFQPEEKSYIFIGTARIDHSACLMWQDGVQGKNCLVCDEHCPYGAIYIDTVNGKRVPYVNDALCVGCGTCEKGCPVGPDAAIRVLNEKPYGDKRHMTIEQQRAWQQQARTMYPSQ